jgi:amino acid transporter
MMAIVVGFLFYTVVIAAVSYAAPWRALAGERFMTAVVFERAVGSRWIVSVVMTAALVSLLKVFNGNFIAASRLLFSMGRRRLLDSRLGAVHSRNHTPAAAVLWIGVATAVCMVLGDAILVPVAEVGSVASASGWLASCAAYYCMRPARAERGLAAFGVVLGVAMVLMKVLPGIPGHFSGFEWLALGIWIVIGGALGWHGLSKGGTA